MRSMQWHGRIAFISKAFAQPAHASAILKDRGAAGGSEQCCLRRWTAERDHEPLLLVESDLSGDMAVEDKELDAIIRLIGGALDDILSGTGGE